MVNWGSGAAGAASGAAAGTAILPGWGTAIGGVVGGIAGLFGGPDDVKPANYQDRAEMLSRIRTGYGAGGITSYGQDSAFRDAQLRQLGQLQGIASGQQQGAGELATQRQMANANAAQQSMARMARGGNAALAYRNAANNTAANGISAAGLGQQAALQDQMNAQGLLSQVGAAGRQGDFATNQLNSSNYLALLNGMNSMDAAQLGGANAANIANASNQNAFRGSLLSAGGQAAGMLGQRSGQGQQPQLQTPGWSGGAGGGGGGDNLMRPDGTVSDERAKTAVADARGDIDRMLDGLATSRGPVSFVYRDPAAAEAAGGRVTGVMAQDLERSPAGKSMVADTPAGKVVDAKKAAMVALAASARLHERLKQLEDERPLTPSAARMRPVMAAEAQRQYQPVVVDPAAALAAERQRQYALQMGALAPAAPAYFQPAAAPAIAAPQSPRYMSALTPDSSGVYSGDTGAQ